MNKLFPKREDFLDKWLYKELSLRLRTEREILFMPNGVWDERHMQIAEYQSSKYKIVLFGVLEDGRRLSVIVCDIEPYFEVRVPNDVEAEGFAEGLMDGLDMNLEDYGRFCELTGKDRAPGEYWKIKASRYEIIEGKPLKYFQIKPSKYVRIYFDKLYHRRDAIEYVRAQGFETAHDDLNNYYRVACRDHLVPLAAWLVLQNYIFETSNPYIRGEVVQISINDLRPHNGEKSLTDLRKDKTLSLCWDIETFNHGDDGKVPEPTIFQGKKEIPNLEHVMFMIGITFQWFNSNEQLLRVCLVDVPSAPNPDFLTVECGTEENLIRAFAKCVNRMRPEIIMGFNDASYDWPWVIKRAKYYRGLLSYIGAKFNAAYEIPGSKHGDEAVEAQFKNIQIKIEADMNATGNNLQLPGYIPVDVMLVFRQLYPTSKQWSLKFFLAANKLGGKEDMPYQEMFEIYRRALEYPADSENQKRMSLVAKYCVVDAQRCHELMKIRSVIQDKREVSNISYTSIFDAFYRANGMKVRNLVIARGQLRGLKASNITVPQRSRGKYPGAWVFPPIKGLVTSKLSVRERIQKAKMGYPEYAPWIEKTEAELEAELQDGPLLQQILDEPTGRPVTGLDFSSLYPSLIMTYNLSPEYIVVDPTLAAELEAEGHTLHEIQFWYSGEMVHGWSVRHDNHLDPAAPDYKFGLYPAILKELFDARAALKRGEKGLIYWERQKENLLLIAKNDPARWESKEVQQSYEDACFNFNALDSKQKALKVFMNTFYGEAGSQMSPLYMLLVAGGITSAGQQNIKTAYNFVEEKQCKIYYGDTDSLYISIPESIFSDLDRVYFSGKIPKLEYWEKMVLMTFEQIQVLNAEVNAMFRRDNGTEFLKMSYEEVLFPVLFLAKKKYVGLPHISQPNFDSSVPLFVRGIDLKKRNASEIMKQVCSAILRECVSPENVLTVIEIVQRKIREIYTSDWSDKFDYFLMNDAYKPHKQNIKMQRFSERMLAERQVKLKPGERVDYVIVKKFPYTYDMRGRKIPLKVGDKMELAAIAREEKMEIDLDYYMENTINGQMARFITYHSDFYVAPMDYSEDAEVKRAEDKILQNARKFIDSICQEYYTKYEDLGKAHKERFRRASKLVNEKLLGKYGDETEIIRLMGRSVDLNDEIGEWMIKKIYDRAEKKSENQGWGEAYVRGRLAANPGRRRQILARLNRVFGRLSAVCETCFRDRDEILRYRMHQSLERVKSLFEANHCIIQRVIAEIEHGAEDAGLSLVADNAIATRDTVIRENLEEVKYLYINLLGNYEYILRVRKIAEYLEYLRNRKARVVMRPEDVEARVAEMCMEATVEYTAELH